MTAIKFCGLTRLSDIEAANACHPEYIGFVFSERSRRRITRETAEELKRILDPDIKAVGVFTDESPEVIAELLDSGVIDMAQLHGMEDEIRIRSVKALTDRPVIKAFRVETIRDIYRANMSPADLVLLDAGVGGEGRTFDRSLLAAAARPYFLAGGLRPETVGQDIRIWKPFAVDVSSGIETEGRKDPEKMKAFAKAVRTADEAGKAE